MSACGATAVLVVSPVVVDESVAAAQVLTGVVSYPPDHPAPIFFSHATNLGNLLTTLAFRVWPAPEALSAARNWLCVFMSLLVPYVFGLALSGRAVVGLIAAAITTTETATFLSVQYPLFVFPTFYSHGHLGMHAGLLAAGLLLLGASRSGGLLLGLMPAIHPVMALPAWGWVAADRATRAWGRPWFGRGTAFLAVGAVVSALLIFGNLRSASSTPTDAAALSVYRNFTASLDGHRAPLDPVSRGALLNPLLSLGLAVLLLMATRSAETMAIHRRARSVVGFSAAVWAVVFGAAAAKWWMGRLPVPVEMMMPFRFGNWTALIVVPVLCALGAELLRRQTRSQRLVSLALGLGIVAIGSFVMLAAATGLDLPGAYRARVLGTPDRLLPCLAAVVCGWTIASTGPHSFRAVGLAVASMLLAGLAAVQPDVAGVFVALVVVSGVLARTALPGVRHAPNGRLATAVAAVVVVGLVAVGSTSDRSRSALRARIVDDRGRVVGRWDWINPHDRQLRDWLDRNTQPADALMAPLFGPRQAWQVKLGHPVVLDVGTLYAIAYDPASWLPVRRLVRDVCGVDLASTSDVASLPVAGLSGLRGRCQQTWRDRTVDEWRRLTAGYGTTLVFAPNPVQLAFEPTLELPVGRLYVIK